MYRADDGLCRLVPFERLGRVLVVSRDELADRGFQVSNAGEDTSIQRPSLQLRKPAFHCIQPRRAGRCEVQLEARMFFQLGLDRAGFVGRTVVQNHMEIQLSRHVAINLSEKIQELLGPVPLGDPAHYFTSHDVERGVQTCRAMALVIMGSPLNLPGPKLQHWLSTIQRLDLGFLVNREHHGVVRRAQIEPDHINDLFGEVRIIADLECLQSVRFEIGRNPDLSNLPGANTRVLGHQLNAPMRCFLGNPLSCQGQDFFDFLSTQLQGLTATRQVAQALDARLKVAFSPLEHRR